MRKTVYPLVLVCVTLMLFSCRTSFEKVMASGNTDKIYNAAFEYFAKKQYLKSQQLFESIINNVRGSEKSEKMYFHYAYTYYHLQNYTLAAYYFKQFSTTFSNSSLREEADFMAAYSNYQLSPSFRLDQGSTNKAIEGFEEFTNAYPNSTKIDECNKLIDAMREKLAQKSFHEGELYLNMGDFQAATTSFNNLLKDYPETKDAERIRFLMTKASFLLANRSVVDKQIERYTSVIANANTFFNKHAYSKYRKELESYITSSNKKIKELSNDRYKTKNSRS
jgi:outer membrane protein assembly factor BamD